MKLIKGGKQGDEPQGMARLLQTDCHYGVKSTHELWRSTVVDSCMSITIDSLKASWTRAAAAFAHAQGLRHLSVVRDGEEGW